MKIFVRAKPGAKKVSVERLEEGLFGKKQEVPMFIVSIKEPAKGGKANRAIERVLAEYFKIPVSSIDIVSGHTSRNKIIEIRK